MSITRRRFLQVSGGLGAIAFSGLSFSLEEIEAKAKMFKLSNTKQTTSVCCYCAVGCGLIVSTRNNKAVNVEGNPDHPTSEGALCAKGSAIFALADQENTKRPKQPMYRAPYSDKWVPISWDEAYKRIARRVKDTRDKGFVEKNEKGEVVNRVINIAHVGSAALDTEEAWAIQAIQRALGLVYIDHQARLCHSTTVPALVESFGRGAMTGAWGDIANSDCIVIIGCNPAENHPISMKWVFRAMEKGTKVFHIDPRYTRTSQVVTDHAQIRSGTDIAFFGGMINYILKNNRIQEEYVKEYTNASFIVGEKFKFNDGLFSGFDPKTEMYDISFWGFELNEEGSPKRDITLKNPRCVFNILKKHYSRYTIEKVSSTTGIPKEKLLLIYDEFTKTHTPDKAGLFMYALGQTQHTYGTQNIRAMAMVQLLLGNIGVSGGGINALRGESNVQGATDVAILADSLPGYLPMPTTACPTLASYNIANTPHVNDPMSTNWWKNRPKYMASLIKSYYPTLSLEEGYSLMPKLDGDKSKLDYTWLAFFKRMYEGKINGFFVWGMNPAVSGAQSTFVRKALTNLDWLVNVNVFENETGSFWKAPGVDPSTIKTEVIFLPCAVSIEKEGSVVDSARMVQWRYAGPKPYAQTRPDGDIMLQMFLAIRELYKKEQGVFTKPIVSFDVDRWITGKHKDEFDPHSVAKIINGYFVKDTVINGVTYKKNSQVPSFSILTDDGSTACGCWIYTGIYTDEGNMMARTNKRQTTIQAKLNIFPQWAYTWPANRRIIYNRAGVTQQGVPFNKERPVIQWTGKEWIGDIPDGGGAPGSCYPFIMLSEGHGLLYTTRLLDAPIPEHYEPVESPLDKNPFSSQLNEPLTWYAYGRKIGNNKKYPCVGTTFRLAEHWQSGVLTRNLPWLLQAEPQSFCVINDEHAKELGITNGSMVKVSSERGSVVVVAMVTKRVQPLTIEGKKVNVVGLPWHFSWTTPNAGEASNFLTGGFGEPNTGIPETKTFLVNIEKATI